MNLHLLAMLSIVTMVIASVASEPVTYRCNCGEIGTYYNPIYVFRQVMGKYRTCWSPLYFNLYSHWNDEEIVNILASCLSFDVGEGTEKRVHVDFVVLAQEIR